MDRRARELLQATEREFLCLHCDHIVVVPAGEPNPRHCPTPGCVRPDGFGEYQGVRKDPRFPTKATSKSRY